eukprot:TRINITY_DN1676_c0_g1_i4.p1 TRINITY_DN1676_c0_g1~~TRINITY_DN1676_c0_g1_i4.p1  ORF type:complete len:192 (-),score=69.41 TRINITY_DN1676_c0_g1_i4:103-597(-)
MNILSLSLFFFALFFFQQSSFVLGDNCEVCIDVLQQLEKTLEKRDDLIHTEDKLSQFCTKAVEKQQKMCYYMEPIKRTISSAFKRGLPVPKICQELKTKDADICDLRYTKKQPIDLSKVDINKLKIRELKDLIKEKGLDCRGCTEKSEFLKVIKKYLETTKKEL